MYQIQNHGFGIVLQKAVMDYMRRVSKGGVPRFLKNSLPFPDIEENKPIEYLMDCYYGNLPKDKYESQNG